MDRLAEAEFERRAEKHFQGHRGLLNGRDYRWNVFRWITDEERDAYRENFDNTFPDAPGSPGWFEKKFGEKLSPVDQYRKNFIPDGKLLRKGVSISIDGKNPTEAERTRNERKILDWFSRAIPAKFFDPDKVTFNHDEVERRSYCDTGDSFYVLKTIGAYIKLIGDTESSHERHRTRHQAPDLRPSPRV